MKNLKKIMLLVMAYTMATAFGYSQEVVELKMPELTKTVVKLKFNVGSTADPDGLEGITALTANLVAEGGIPGMTKSQIDEKIYPWAARYGVSVDKEVTTFTFEVPTVFLNDFYPILKGLILNPSFSESDFNRVKDKQLNYVTRTIKFSSDEDYSKMALEDFLFRGTNYQHMISGTEAGVKNIDLKEAIDHYRTYFTEDNLLIGVAGSYPESFKEKLVSDMQQLPELTTALPEPAKIDMPEGIEVEIISKPGAFGSAIFMGYPLEITREDDEFAALMIANSYMGEHRKSYGRLYSQLRELRSMNYGDYSYIEWYPSGSSNMLPISGYTRSSNYFSLWIRPVQLASGLKAQYPELADINVGHAHFAIRMALYELNKLVEKGMTEEDFQLTKDFLRSYMKLYVNDPTQKLGYLMDSRFYGREDYINEMDELLENVTLEEVNEAIKKHFQIQNMKIAIITTPEEAKVLAENLKKNTASPMSYSNIVKEGLDDSVLQEDVIVSKFPLNVTKVKIVESENMFVQ